jgi:N-acetylmuramic acid 6-phosphate etherase
MLRLINEADRAVADAVAAQLPAIAAAVDAIARRIGAGDTADASPEAATGDGTGGRLFYIGAGTSGRLGVLDASECPPTYNVPPDLVQGIMAGGDAALRYAVEDVEDDPAGGEADLRERRLSARDAVVGIAASGRTPYVLGALDYANRLGALTVGLTCSPDSPLARHAGIAIAPLVGAEIVTGSTRMKAGTATKLVLNMLSTGVMVRLGHVYGNLMVNVQPTNAKLADRACRIVALATGLDREQAEELLRQAGEVKTAIVMQKLRISREEAESRLAARRGHLRRTLEG